MWAVNVEVFETCLGKWKIVLLARPKISFRDRERLVQAVALRTRILDQKLQMGQRPDPMHGQWR